MATRRGLGKGLDSMIPNRKETNPPKPDNQAPVESDAQAQEEPKASDKGKTETLVKISMVEPNKNQPRKIFDDESLGKLAESIQQHGVLQPLLVKNMGTHYEIIAGERRWRAAKIAGLKEIPVIVREYTDQETVEISLIENVQREDLNPIELAKAYRRLSDEFGLTQDTIADRIAKSRSAVTNTMRLLKLEERVQEMLTNEMITEGHAKAILSIEDGEKQIEVATKVFDDNLSVRETEKLVNRILEGPKAKEEEPRNEVEDAIYSSLEEKITGIVGTKVQIQRKRNNKGKIEIEYYSREELDRIIELFESINS